MRRSLCGTAALVLAFLVAAPLTAQTPKPEAAAKPAAQPAQPALSGVRGDVLRQVDAARDKLVALAEATPADKFTWRPNDKVRTVGEVYSHVASGNYGIPTIWGAKVPDGVDPRGFDKEAGDKAKTIDHLKKSFEHVHKAVESASEADLNKTVKIFDHEGTVREGMMIVASHDHEHLGQSIAYARSIGIVPPWSH
jgi:uncharacterized damage-inducible protein DinB